VGYKDGKQNGQGTTTYSNGSKFIGEYKDGKSWNGTGYDKNGNIQVKLVNGKRIRQ
jgi:antitoxin component YwqK of YwqJK toxin-antitoxin module